MFTVLRSPRSILSSCRAAAPHIHAAACPPHASTRLVERRIYSNNGAACPSGNTSPAAPDRRALLGEGASTLQLILAVIERRHGREATAHDAGDGVVERHGLAFARHLLDR